MPKNYARIDLHLHLDGSLSIANVHKLAKLQGIPLPEEEALRKLLSVDESCRDLNDYLKRFDFPLELLQTGEAIRLSVQTLLEELTKQGLFYAEIRFAPQLHCRKGLSQREVLTAALGGIKGSSIPTGLILCCMRGAKEVLNQTTLELAEEFLGNGVVGVDLAGAEGLFPTGDYLELFSFAREKNIPITIHAGEAAGADSVLDALSLGAIRIGHGIRSFESPELMRRLQEEQIPLEMCPTSNLDTHAVASLQEYPLQTYVNRGIPVTVHTDDMTVSNTTLAKEFDLIRSQFGLSDSDLCKLSLNAVNAAFCDEATKEMLRKKILSL